MTKENYFSNKMVNMTNVELQNYVNDKSLYEDEAVLAAIWELEKRNTADGENRSIELQIEQKQKEAETRIEKVKKESNITDDPNAQILYHSRFVLIFGAFFSVFAGSILMALNFARLGNKKIAWLVVFSGLVYSTIQILVMDQIGTRNSGLAFFAGLFGMLILESVFWKRRVPSDLKFRKRSIWGALIISFIVSLPFIYAVIVSEGV
ncbi:MAG: hypothetical protein CVT94_13285 [Bacteroidetes bacterium HGW-Bacteroidetes-11]|jgi:hypothetical protein|nr:MAG: hypothetical protein CVT94_13285 [Bacteroidetes bacterium HGW-Bacteroidetes-11]